MSPKGRVLDGRDNGKPRNRKAFGLTDTMGGAYALEGYDYGARIYLPELSRWASADSITPDTVWEANAFAYTRNNPLKYRDPDGHSVNGPSVAELQWHLLHGPPQEPVPGWQVVVELLPGVGEAADLVRALGWEPFRWRATTAREQSAAGQNTFHSAMGGVFLKRIKGLGDLYRIGAGVPKVRATGGAVTAFLQAASKHGPGRWGADLSETMSEAAARYQRQVSGAPIGAVYRLGGRKFDGFDGQFLLDAKGPGYASFVKDGEFKPWAKAGRKLLSEAQGQLEAAGSTPIKWVFAEKEAADAFKRLLGDVGGGQMIIEHVKPR